MHDEDLILAGKAAETWLAAGARRHLRNLKDDEGERFLRKRKALCELSFLTHCVGTDLSGPLEAALREPLEEVAQDGWLLALLYRHIDHANLFLPLIVAANAVVPLNEPQEADLQGLIAWLERRRRERLPFRSLDLSYSLYRLIGRERHYEAMLEAARQGCLSRAESALDVSPSDDYAVTHTVFYLTDFGAKPWPSALAPLSVVESVLDGLSARGRAAHNYDLVAEYVLCRRLLGLRGRALQVETAGLLAAQEGDGRWNGPADLTDVLRDEGFADDEIEFFSHYHTTLVGMAAVSGLQPSRRPAAPIIEHPHDGEPLLVHRPTDQPERMTPTQALRLAFDALATRSPQLLTPHHRVALASLAEDPNWMLPVLEWHYWAARQGVLPDAEISTFLAALAESDPAEFQDNPRFLRLWLLAEAVLRSAEGDRGRPEFGETFGAGPDDDPEQLLDRLIVTALRLIMSGDRAPESRWELEASLNRFAIEQDELAFAALLAHAASLFTDEPGKLATWARTLGVMSPRSLRFGWRPAPSTPEESAIELKLDYPQLMALCALREVMPGQGDGRLEVSAVRPPSPASRGSARGDRPETAEGPEKRGQAMKAARRAGGRPP